MASIYKSEWGEAAVRERYVQFLDRWPVANKRLQIATRQGETHVIACGPTDAPPVILLHGSAANSAMWMGDVVIWAKDFRVFAVDVIGEPGLSAPSRPPLASEAYALWLDDVMGGLSLDCASFVGISLGGWLALDYGKRYASLITDYLSSSHLATLPAGIIQRDDRIGHDDESGTPSLSVIAFHFGKRTKM